MPRLIFLNRFFFPDQSATSQILSDLAFHLAERGFDVHVVTSRQLYESPKARLPAQETVRGVTIHRVFSTRFGRTSLAGRAFDYLSYYAAVASKIIRVASRDDVIIAKTDPPLISVLAMWAARIRGAKLVNWLQDIYPEIAIETGVPLIKGPIGRILSLLRDASLKAAVANVAVGRQMANRLISQGAKSDTIHVIPNWCDDEAIVPVANADNPLRQKWGLQHKFVVGYSGNLGRGHEFNTLLASAERFRGDPDVMFVLIGGGQRFEQLKRLVAEKGLDTIFRFFPYQDRDRLKHSLAVADMHWISLQAGLEDLMFPSKFYGIAAAGRPILAVTGATGEIANLVKEYSCGTGIKPGDDHAMAQAIGALSRDRARCDTMGRNARIMLDAKFTRRRQLETWSTLLGRIAAA